MINGVDLEKLGVVVEDRTSPYYGLDSMRSALEAAMERLQLDFKEKNADELPLSFKWKQMPEDPRVLIVMVSTSENCAISGDVSVTVTKTDTVDTIFPKMIFALAEKSVRAIMIAARMRESMDIRRMAEDVMKTLGDKIGGI